MGVTTRTADQAMDEVLAVTPAGFAWPATRGSRFEDHLSPWADALANAEAAMANLVAQSDIRNAVELLPDYEAALGPDPVGRITPGTSIAERQLIAWQRWTTRGPRTPAFFVALAARLGVAITIDEGWLSELGLLECGDELAVDPEQFVWRVNLPGPAAAAAVQPIAGVVALIQRLNPPHMQVSFRSVG